MRDMFYKINIDEMASLSLHWISINYVIAIYDTDYFVIYKIYL